MHTENNGERFTGSPRIDNGPVDPNRIGWANPAAWVTSRCIATLTLRDRRSALQSRVFALVIFRADPETGTATFDPGELLRLSGVKGKGGPPFTDAELARSLDWLVKFHIFAKGATSTSITLNPEAVMIGTNGDDELDEDGDL